MEWPGEGRNLSKRGFSDPDSMFHCTVHRLFAFFATSKAQCA